MREKTLNLLGLMRKANAIAVGETNTGGAVRAGKASCCFSRRTRRTMPEAVQGALRTGATSSR